MPIENNPGLSIIRHPQPRLQHIYHGLLQADNLEPVDDKDAADNGPAKGGIRVCELDETGRRLAAVARR